MIQSLTDEELEFMECFYNPLCIAESLFSNFDKLSSMEEEKLGHVRTGQIGILSYEYLLAYNPNLSEKENFELKENTASTYIYGGRNWGKSLLEKIDVVTTLLVEDGLQTGLTSYDAIHIRGILEPVIDCMEHHPILKHFKSNIKRSPTYYLATKNGNSLDGINMNVSSKSSGDQFFQKHLKKIWVEEASFEPEEVYKKRIDSKHELGWIEKVSGMTNFTKYSPAGRVFYDLTKKAQVLNIPQFVNPYWDDKEKQKAIKKYNGEQSVGFRIFVKGQVVEEGVSVFDMERIRPNYVEGRKIKYFEVHKSDFFDFKTTLHALETPKSAIKTYVCADIGESAPTEIIVVIQTANTHKYLYNITLFNLTDKEQYKVFSYISKKLNATFICLDTTDGCGRAIFRSLEEEFGKEHMVWCSFNEKLPIGFEKDEYGNVVLEKGKPKEAFEYVSEWSIKHLKDLLYDNKIELPYNAYKFDVQINSVIASTSGNRTIYSCISEENHLFQAFQTFSIAHWYNEFNDLNPIVKKDFSKIGVH